jgi:hypothetical protein
MKALMQIVAITAVALTVAYYVIGAVILDSGGLPKGGTTIAQPFKVGYERARTHPVPNGTADSTN